ncbi:acetylxylan esterase [Demequina sp. SO4-13]|uniref:acetylxylan esterase n=1 Tax=Demequina sp. SO4-13 TaxID=3401027 RepID=UPI003AF41F50
MALFDLPRDQLETYRPEIREPADFDEFWRETLADARGREMSVSLAPGPIAMGAIEIQDVTYPGFGGHPHQGVVRPSRGS